MWFAALGSYEYNPWFVHLVFRLLQGQRDVLDLLAKNPFPDRAPTYIRAKLYKYHYTELPRNISSLSDVLHNNRLVMTMRRSRLLSSEDVFVFRSPGRCIHVAFVFLFWFLDILHEVSPHEKILGVFASSSDFFFQYSVFVVTG